MRLRLHDPLRASRMGDRQGRCGGRRRYRASLPQGRRGSGWNIKDEAGLRRYFRARANWNCFPARGRPGRQVAGDHGWWYGIGTCHFDRLETSPLEISATADQLHLVHWQVGR